MISGQSVWVIRSILSMDSSRRLSIRFPWIRYRPLKIRQSFLARIGHRYKAEIVNVGIGDDKEEQHSFLVLYCTEEKLRKSSPAASSGVRLFSGTAGRKAACFGMGGMDSSGGHLYHFCSSRSARVQRSDGRQIPSAYLGYCGGSGHNAVCRYGAEIPYCRSRGGRQVFKDCRRIFCHAVSTVRYRNIQYVEFPRTLSHGPSG